MNYNMRNHLSCGISRIPRHYVFITIDQILTDMASPEQHQHYLVVFPIRKSMDGTPNEYYACTEETVGGYIPVQCSAQYQGSPAGRLILFDDIEKARIWVRQSHDSPMCDYLKDKPISVLPVTIALSTPSKHQHVTYPKNSWPFHGMTNYVHTAAADSVIPL